MRIALLIILSFASFNIYAKDYDYDYKWTHNHPILIEYVRNNRESILNWTPQKLSNSKTYNEFIYNVLKKEGVPKEIIILAAIESGFRTDVVSQSQAVGMWQFLENTGREWGLEINHKKDERQDWKKSTVAAAKYLKWMSEKHFNGNYEMAILAYNAGLGNIKKLMKKYNTDDPWVIISTGELKKESNEFLPKFLSYLHYYYYIENKNRHLD